MKLKAACAALLVAAALPAGAQHASPYAGQERNEIKALSAQEVNSLLAGHGMGYAKAAELNGYPGPMHVSELAEQLALTPQQLKSSQQLMHEHKERARRLGAEVVAAERALDQLFRDRRADATAVASGAERIGLLQAQLRAEHLNTHLLQTALLSTDQARRYTELRGYAGATPSGPGQDSPPSHHRKTH